MGRVLPEFLSKWTTERVREEGVNVIPNTEVKNVNLTGNNQIELTLSDGQTIQCDRVVVAVGSEPNTGLGTESGLEIEKNHGGYLVNTELAARNNLYVVSATQRNCPSSPVPVLKLHDSSILFFFPLVSGWRCSLFL